LGISSSEGAGIDFRAVEVMAKLPHRAQATDVRCGSSSNLAGEAQIGQ
jgi:hypothetical protein